MNKLKLLIGMFFLTNLIFSQEKIINGMVKDSLNVIVSATIHNKTKRAYTQTDFNGKFSLKVSLKDTLLVTYLGKSDKTILITDFNDLTIALKDSGITLETVLPYESNLRKKVVTTTIENIQINKIYLLGGWASVITQKEIDFTKKYGIPFHDFGCTHPENIEEYEELNCKTFNYLNKKYGKKWQKEINPNTLGFQKWLKK